MPPTKPADVLARKGPFDEAEIGRRINQMRSDLEITVADVIAILGWSESAWTEKVSAVRNRFSIKDTSAVVAAFKVLRPQWHYIFPWPYVDSETAELLKDTLMPKVPRKH